MSSGAVVQDPFLQSVLTASVHAREQCMQLIELAEHSAVTPSKTIPDDTKFQLSALQRQLNANLARLRQASRDSIFEVRATKQDTAEARQEVDRLHLQLQNLYYEERHLRGEISACESYEYLTFSPCVNQILSLTVFAAININSSRSSQSRNSFRWNLSTPTVMRNL